MSTTQTETLPTEEELDGILKRLSQAVEDVDRLSMRLQRDEHERPTLSDIGAFYSFTVSLEALLGTLGESRDEISAKLRTLDEQRINGVYG